MYGLVDYWIYLFQNDQVGNLWIGIWVGVNLFNVKIGKFKIYVKELINEWVYGLIMDVVGCIWFGIEGGVLMFDGKCWKLWIYKDGLGGDNFNNLLVSFNMGLGIWLCYDFSIQVEGFFFYNLNYVFLIYIVLDGNIWVGIWGGGVS